MLRAGGWTNAAAQLLTFEEENLVRDVSPASNYFGYVAFADGEPTTGAYDYPFWQLSIE